MKEIPDKFTPSSHQTTSSHRFDIHKSLSCFDEVMKDFPKIKIKHIPEDMKIENTPVFYLLLERFNRIFQDIPLSVNYILTSRPGFTAFYDFVFYCSLQHKIEIERDQLPYFMLALDSLRQRYSQNLRSIDKHFDEIFVKIYCPRELTKTDPIVIKDRYRFEQAYSLMKLVFENKKRENGKRYFDHLKGVMDIVLNELEKPNIERILIALLHDVQEDLPEYFDAIRNIYGDYIADGVHILSKKEWSEYLTEEEAWACNPLLEERKRLFANAFASMKQRHPEDTFTAADKTDEKKLKNYMSENQKKRLDVLEKKITPFIHLTKPRRNEDYFGHMNDLNDDYLAVKLADRIHNLRDMDGGVERDKIVRKVYETEKYFLPVAQERNPKAYALLVNQVAILKKQWDIL